MPFMFSFVSKIGLFKELYTPVNLIEKPGTNFFLQDNGRVFVSDP